MVKPIGNRQKGTPERGLNGGTYWEQTVLGRSMGEGANGGTSLRTDKWRSTEEDQMVEFYWEQKEGAVRGANGESSLGTDSRREQGGGKW